ncbi:MAG: oxidoreductase [Flaviaesturariibacter sp.]|nr:oxidoreductase [Flaviaesturariibacter sp.]
MPDAIFADIRIIRQASQVDDYFEVLCYYPDKRVRLHSSYLVREPLPAYIIHGNKGSFIKTKSDVQETALQAGRTPDAIEWGKEPETEQGLLHSEIDGRSSRQTVPSENGNYLGYYEGIYNAIRHGNPLPVSAEEGLDVIRIITAAFESNEKRQVIDL